MADMKDRPVLTGLIALVAVAAVIGVIGGLAALVGSKVLGLGGDVEVSSDNSSSSDRSLYLPEPTITSETPESEATQSPTVDPVEPPTSEEPSTDLTLSAAQTTVTPMGQIDLSGSYAAEGAILQVQQRVGDGEWRDFPVTMRASGGTFSGYVQTGQAGENTFRMVDTDKDVMSNEVVVTVG